VFSMGPLDHLQAGSHSEEPEGTEIEAMLGCCLTKRWRNRGEAGRWRREAAWSVRDEVLSFVGMRVVVENIKEASWLGCLTKSGRWSKSVSQYSVRAPSSLRQVDL
jgi:hypothetical protein